jgi:glycosyltransferase involved in cell wall biosynthesis
MEGPLVSIGMSVFNAEQTVAMAIESLLRQTLQEWELLLVDDGSSDRTLEVLRRFNDPRIRLFSDSHGRKGLPARLNQCLDRAHGIYFARMDADDISYKERLERQVDFLRVHPEVDLLATGAICFKGDGQVLGLYPVANDHGTICRRYWWGFPMAHPTWMGRRSWFLRYRYRESARRVEDQDLLLRSFRSSRFAVLKDVLFGYRIERTSVRNSFWGRLYYCRALFSQAHDLPTFIDAAKGLTTHSLALARDFMRSAIAAGGVLNNRSMAPANPVLVDQWLAVWSGLSQRQ